MAERNPDSEILEDNSSRHFPKERIVRSVREIPDPLSGFCAWILVGACDLAKVLLAGRDLASAVSEIEHDIADEARQTMIAFSAAETLRKTAADFERRNGRTDVAKARRGSLLQARERASGVAFCAL